RPQTPPRPSRNASSQNLAERVELSHNIPSAPQTPPAALSITVPEPVLPILPRLRSPVLNAPTSTPVNEFIAARAPGSPNLARSRTESRMKYSSPDPSVLLRQFPSPGIESEISTAPSSPADTMRSLSTVPEVQSL